MKKFLDKDFLLETETAKILYHDYASKMPIIDYHCHINPQEIAENRKYDNITQVWLGGDHYKWRVMRNNGVPENVITYERETNPFGTFKAFCESLPRAIGNPMYHWTYLELREYFGVETQITKDNVEEIYNELNEKISKLDVRSIIEQSNVKIICTTDDPIDDLKWHKFIKEDETCKVTVLPSFRPDKAMAVDKDGYADYIAKLAEVSKTEINSFADVCTALGKRVEFFNEVGCSVSDHGLDYPIYSLATSEELDAIFTQALTAKVDSEKGDKFKTAVMLYLAEQYSKYNWVMQLHYGCQRNVAQKMFNKIGPDTGYDIIAASRGSKELCFLLNAMDEKDNLPKTIIYSLNAADNETIATIAGSFQTDSGVKSKVQLGSAWWFNDTKTGMVKQLTDYANIGVLGNFIGMLTDSRSFLSYTRHEYFRRILCNLIGTWVENGEYHGDIELLGSMVQDISYNNTVNYFGFDKYLD
ncbi:MAG: glucuronate isomerase [Clostridia bacterium]